MWIWIVIGTGSFVGLSLLIGFAFARILGTIGREIGELYERETWAALPPTRAAKGVNSRIRPRSMRSPRASMPMFRRLCLAVRSRSAPALIVERDQRAVGLVWRAPASE